MTVLARGIVLAPIVGGVSCFTRSSRRWLGTVRFLPTRMVATSPTGTAQEFCEFSTALDWLRDN